MSDWKTSGKVLIHPILAQLYWSSAVITPRHSKDTFIPTEGICLRFMDIAFISALHRSEERDHYTC